MADMDESMGCGWLTTGLNLQVIAPQEISDNVAIFQTAAGGELFVTKYEDSDLENGFTDLANPPQNR